ncbi:MAG: DUF5667 domain-containing protein [bacterium]|nr:DUF5667 domain-containing protein [bacterium]
MKVESLEKIEERLLKFKGLQPNPAWKSGLRTIISSRFEKEDYIYPRFHWSFRLSLVGSFVLTLLLTTAYFSAQSLPGDSLYHMKRSYEDLALRSSDSQGKVQLEQNLTSKRIEELKKTVVVKNTAVGAALTEVKKSVSKVSTELASAKSKSKDDPEIASALKKLPSSLTQNQKDLTTIQASLRPEDQKEVVSIINSLEQLKVEIRQTISQEPETPQGNNSPDTLNPN